MRETEARNKLAKYGQQHLMQYFDSLDENGREELLTQIENTDFEVLNSLNQQSVMESKGTITPLAAMEINEIEQKKSQFEEIGLKTIREGKVGAVLLAGGMGTRLGSDAPKGVYDIGLTRPVFIFQRLIENLLEVVERAGTCIPLYIMTSDKNHEATVAFFEKQDYFGYQKESVTFFMQDMAPASDYDGKVFLEAKGKISTSPNGNGGWYSSMHKWGIAQKAAEQGVKYSDILHLPHGMTGYFDFEQGMAAARTAGKPVFLDFTGHGCVNCREMLRGWQAFHRRIL